MRVLALLLILLAPAKPTFVMVRLGDDTATPKKAAGFLMDFSAYLAKSTGAIEGRITNRADRAVILSKQARLVFAPCGFYLAHLHPAPAVAQIPRFGATSDRYYLVTRKDGPNDLAGKRVVAAASSDPAYLKRVVFHGRSAP